MNTSIEPIELTDDELKAVAGGQFTITNSSFSSNSSANNSTTAAVALGSVSAIVLVS